MPKKTKHQDIDQVVEKLHSQLKDKLVSHPELNNKWCTKKFVLARNGNLEKSKEMFEKYIKYRDENFERIRAKKFDKEKMDKLNCRGLYKTTKDGIPVLIERIGYTDAKQIMKDYTKQDVIDYYTQFYERLVHIIFPQCSQKQNKRIDKIFSIIDLKDSNLLSLLYSDFKNFLKSYTELSQNYYPEMLNKLVIINAPFVFKTVWAVVKYWVDKKTRSKFIIHNGNGMESLLQYIDINDIPKELGGKSQETLYEQPGPWQPQLDYAIKKNKMEAESDHLFVKYFLNPEEQKQIQSAQNQFNTKSYKSQVNANYYDKLIEMPENKSKRFHSVVCEVKAHVNFNQFVIEINYGKVKRNKLQKKLICLQEFSTTLFMPT